MKATRKARRRQCNARAADASRAPLIRLSATFSPPSGEKERRKHHVCRLISRYGRRPTASLSPPCGERVPTAGEGRRSQGRRRGRSTANAANVMRGRSMHRARPSSGPVSGTGQALRPPSPRPAGEGAFAVDLPPSPRVGQGRYRGDCDSSQRKRVPRQRSSTGTHLQPSWTKLGLRTTVPMWSPWLFTWIRRAAAAAPTTRAVWRGVRKGRVNARCPRAENWGVGHMRP